MKNREFLDTNHAHQYLVGTVIQVNGEPVYVADIGGRRGALTFQYYPLDWPIGRETGRAQVLRLDDPSIDMTPVPLGFFAMNDPGMWQSQVGISHSAFLWRNPVRRSRVGLCSSNLMHSCRYPFGLALANIILSAGLHDTIKGIFPSPADALKNAKKYKGTYAFHRNWALSGDGKLWYKSLTREPVGHMDSGEFKLGEQFFYLKEQLAEDTQ